MMFKDVTTKEIDEIMNDAWDAFHKYRKCSLKERANFMRAIAIQIEQLGNALIQTALEETNLPEARLKGERVRTIYQLNSYANACERGDWLEVRINTAVPDSMPPKPDLRKMLVPLGPVIVFGASNFPFAYSTAGGDTACAFAAGCPVIVKAHPAHAQTSEMMASAIKKAAAVCGLPDGIFTHVHGITFEVGQALVQHPLSKAVGFTGSFSGGKQLFDWANARKEPIPIFAEMSSINPVYLMPEKLKKDAYEVARLYAKSITLDVGQFCTNPGLLIGLDNDDLKTFTDVLSGEIEKISPATMLHQGISNNYKEKRNTALKQEEVDIISVSTIEAGENQGIPTIAATTAQAFIENPVLHQEVFGPYSLIIKCGDITQMIDVAKHIKGQLTATLMATDDDIKDNENLVEEVKNHCGRFILNGVPTGVEVCLAQQHGGPFPATTDSQFTSVGADGIKRFARPVAFQNWGNDLLPEELKNENPLGIWRTINDVLTKDEIVN